MLYLFRQMFVYCGIGLMLCPLADVIAFSVIIGDFGADVITLIFFFLRLMLLPCGRWNGHWVNFDICLADVIAMWQMLWPLGGLFQF